MKTLDDSGLTSKRAGLWAVKYLSLMVTGLIFISCHSTDIDHLNQGLFEAQTKLMKLEEKLESDSQEFKQENQKITKKSTAYSARQQEDISRIQTTLATLKGEMGRLEVGVQTGLLPGADSSQSMAGKLEDMSSRLKVVDNRLNDIEVAQAEILKTLESLQKRKGKGKKSRKRKTIHTLIAVKTAFKQKRYSHIVEDYGSFKKKIKGKSLAQANYLRAESLYKLGRINEAALAFNDLLDTQNSKSREAAIRLRMGDCFRHLGDVNTAKIYYSEVVEKFPNSVEAKEGQKKLSKIN